MATTTTRQGSGGVLQRQSSKELHNTGLTPGAKVSKLRHLFEAPEDKRPVSAKATNGNSNKPAQLYVSLSHREKPVDPPKAPVKGPEKNFNFDRISTDFSSTSSEDDSENKDPHIRFEKAFKLFESNSAFQKGVSEKSPLTSPKRKYESGSDGPLSPRRKVAASTTSDSSQRSEENRHSASDTSESLSKTDNSMEDLDMEEPDKRSSVGPMSKVLHDFMSPPPVKIIDKSHLNSREEDTKGNTIETTQDAFLSTDDKNDAKCATADGISLKPTNDTKVKAEVVSAEETAPVVYRPKYNSAARDSWKRRSFDEVEPYHPTTISEVRSITPPGKRLSASDIIKQDNEVDLAKVLGLESSLINKPSEETAPYEVDPGKDIQPEISPMPVEQSSRHSVFGEEETKESSMPTMIGTQNSELSNDTEEPLSDSTINDTSFKFETHDKNEVSIEDIQVTLSGNVPTEEVVTAVNLETVERAPLPPPHSPMEGVVDLEPVEKPKRGL